MMSELKKSPLVKKTQVHPPAFGFPFGSEPTEIFKIFGNRKLESHCYMMIHLTILIELQLATVRHRAIA